MLRQNPSSMICVSPKDPRYEDPSLQGPRYENPSLQGPRYEDPSLQGLPKVQKFPLIKI